MKIKRFIFIPCLPALLFTGCTSAYVKKDFPSEAEFLNDTNKNSGSALQHKTYFKINLI